MITRTFISIPVKTKDSVSGLATDLKTVRGVKVTDVKQLHLTLKFVGDTNEKDYPKIESCIRKSMEGITPSSISLKGVGTFPEKGSPKVVWIGVETAMDLIGLSKLISENLHAAGIEHDEKAFKAHMTVGRINGKVDLTSIIDKYKDMEFCTVELPSVRFMKSELLPSGAKHSIISNFEF